MIHKKMKKLMFMSVVYLIKRTTECTGYTLTFCFLDRNNPKSKNQCKNELIYRDYEAVHCEKKKLAVVVFKPDNTHLLVFKRCVKRESYSILVKSN